MVKFSQRFQVLDEVALLRGAETKVEPSGVAPHDLHERRVSAVVVEAALGARPESLERRRTVTAIGRAIGLEAVDADLLGLVHVPAGLREERRHVAARAIRLALEQRRAALRRGGIEAAGRRGRRRPLS